MVFLWFPDGCPLGPRQKEGKRKLREIAKVQVPPEAVRAALPPDVMGKTIGKWWLSMGFNGV